LDAVTSLQAVFPAQRQIVFARELTKLFEEIHRCDLGDAVTWIKQDAHREKGEFVVLLEGDQSESDNKMQEATRILKILLEECSVKQAASIAAKITGEKKNALYQLALDLRPEDDE